MESIVLSCFRQSVFYVLSGLSVALILSPQLVGAQDKSLAKASSDTQSQNDLLPKEHSSLVSEPINSVKQSPDQPKDKLFGLSPLMDEFMPPQAATSLSSLGQNSPMISETLLDERPAIAQNPLQSPFPSNDPELGEIRVHDPIQDSELGIIRLRSPRLDSELGILQLRPLPPERPEPDPAEVPPPDPPSRRQSVFLTSYVSTSTSDNIFLRADPEPGTFIRSGVSILAFPTIGPRTLLIASAESNFLRYQEEDFFGSSYDEVRLRAGVRHVFTERIYGQVSWSTQFLFREGFGDRFFTSNGLEVFIGRRDPLMAGLTLDSYYQGRVLFRHPRRFSSVAQSLGTSLSYRFNPQWDARLGYQMTITDFTHDDRHETYQRITGQLRYSLSPSVRMAIFGGISYGRSSEPIVSFDDTFVGVSIDATLGLF